MHEEPQPLADGHEVGSLNDQHALVDVPADSPLAVGDMVACGISHPCTTFDRWQLLPVVDDEYNVVAAVRTFF
jgi:D-serine dehydratase